MKVDETIMERLQKWIDEYYYNDIFCRGASCRQLDMKLA